MTRPRGEASKCGNNPRVNWCADSRFVDRKWDNCSSSPVSRVPGAKAPALCTKTSKAGNTSETARIQVWHPSGVDTSATHVYNGASGNRARHTACMASHSDDERATTATAQPCAANVSAIALPMPLLPPLTAIVPVFMLYIRFPFNRDKRGLLCNILFSNLPGTLRQPFVGCKFVERHGAAGVEFLGADADFRP